jgi:hypothetical protein
MEQENKNTITEEVFKKLEEGQVKPIARWHFVLRNNTFWALWGLSVAIGSCASAATIFVFFNAGWQYQSVTHDSFFRFLLDTLPLFWLVAIGLMVFFGYYNIRHTNRGYRFSVYLVMISSVIASFIGGTILYTLGIAGDIDDIKRPLPFTDSLVLVEETRWNDDTRGLASGIVKSFNKDQETLDIVTFKGEEKIIFTAELPPRDIALLEVGANVRIIGTADIHNNQIFVACAVLPWDIALPRQKPRPMMYLQNEKLSERKEGSNRISICKDVRPYQNYRRVLITH